MAPMSVCWWVGWFVKVRFICSSKDKVYRKQYFFSFLWIIKRNKEQNPCCDRTYLLWPCQIGAPIGTVPFNTIYSGSPLRIIFFLHRMTTDLLRKWSLGHLLLLLKLGFLGFMLPLKRRVKICTITWILISFKYSMYQWLGL